ncbi:MAG: glycogen synthase GlgA [Betaproteobacteria bacterium]
MRVLYATSECAPWIKTGGLGDVAAALPAALHAQGVDARVLMPAYRNVLGAANATREIATLALSPPWPAARLRAATLPSGVAAFLIECPSLFDREGGPYQDAHDSDYGDNDLRFAFLSRVAAWLSMAGSPLVWRPDVLHCNDWQTGLAPAYLAAADVARAATVMTIHNLAFQGSFAGNRCTALGLPSEFFAIDGVEFYGQTSFLKAGVVYADALSTVSPTYAREIQRPTLGFGFEGLLAQRADVLTGILNGIDLDIWNPASDPSIAVRYDTDTLSRKAGNKAALQRALGLEPIPDAVLLGVVSRLTWQKGADLLAELVPRLADTHAQFAIVGRGSAEVEARLAALARATPSRVSVALRFDEALAHLVEAGADAFLMPSRYEPCGLNQMYSQRYGTPPVARATGGLVDSITDATPQALARGAASGFLFGDATLDAFEAAVRRMLGAHAQPTTWNSIQRAAMARDFGWEKSAADHVRMYERAIDRRQSG